MDIEKLKKIGDRHEVTLDDALISVLPRAGKPFKVHASKWGGEAFLNFEPININIDSTSSSVLDGIVRGKNSKISHSCYVKKDDLTRHSAHGNFEYDVVLEKRHTLNEIQFLCEHSPNLEFAYQPIDLLPWEHDASRLPGVAGSIAVYHDKCNNKYKTGKLCHIYGMRAFDSSGKTLYIPITFSPQSKIFSGILDWDWFDSAVYPVVIDPTFGYTSVGGTEYSSNEISVVDKVTFRHTANINDTVTKISIYAKKNPNNCTIDLAIYAHDGTDPTTRLGTASRITINSDTAQWWDTAALTKVMSDDVEYATAYGNLQTSGIYIYYDAGTASAKYKTPTAVLPSTWDKDGDSQGSGYVSIYATYAAGFDGDTTENVLVGAAINGARGYPAANTFPVSVAADILGIAAKASTFTHNAKLLSAQTALRQQIASVSFATFLGASVKCIGDGKIWQSELTTFSSKKKIHINSPITRNNVNVKLDLSAFGDDFWDYLEKEDGSDIRFTDDSVESLYRSIDSNSFSTVNKTGYADICVDLSSSGTDIWCYYGEASGVEVNDEETWWKAGCYQSFHLTESSGNAVNSAGGENGVCIPTANIAQTEITQGYAGGKFGTCYHWPDRDLISYPVVNGAYVKCGEDVLGSRDITVLAWTKLVPNPSYFLHYGVAAYGGTGGVMVWDVNYGHVQPAGGYPAWNAVAWMMWDQGANQNTYNEYQGQSWNGRPMIPENEWVFTAGKYDHTTMYIRSYDGSGNKYVGTSFTNPTADLVSPNGVDKVIRIGSRNGGPSDSWMGELCEFRVYNYAMSTEEIDFQYAVQNSTSLYTIGERELNESLSASVSAIITV